MVLLWCICCWYDVCASYVSLQQDEVSIQSKAACQAMAALLLANIHAPDFKPAITLTDLGDRHSIFWLDGFSIMYYAAPNAATAWALTKALLVWDLEDHNNAQSNRQLPQSVEPLAKRRKFDVHTMCSSGGELAQLAMLSDSLSSQESKGAQQPAWSSSSSTCLLSVQKSARPPINPVTCTAESCFVVDT